MTAPTDWIPWAGGKCPVDGDVLVQIAMKGDSPERREHGVALSAKCWFWNAYGGIVAYRVVGLDTAVDA